MEKQNEILNRVVESSLVTFDLEDLYTHGERVSFDIGSVLYEGLVLREKDFREFVKNNNWSEYTDKLVNVFCSTDAIIPTWAYMLIASCIQPYARKLVMGSTQTLEEVLFSEAIGKVEVGNFREKRVVVKGCSKVDVPDAAYFEITNKLLPVVKSIMFGEACSTVPIYKKH